MILWLNIQNFGGIIVKYRIEVTEHISGVFETEAKTQRQALDIIEKKYFDEKITVER